MTGVAVEVVLGYWCVGFVLWRCVRAAMFVK